MENKVTSGCTFNVDNQINLGWGLIFKVGLYIYWYWFPAVSILNIIESCLTFSDFILDTADEFTDFWSSKEEGIYK